MTEKDLKAVKMTEEAKQKRNQNQQHNTKKEALGPNTRK